ncbi:MAG: histidinol-phosphatase [Desulfobacterales bacterium]|nr:histidinol-phosphatase [Desulfobacterales bacterium]
MSEKNKELISLHGGHSGQFCDHAVDGLEQIVRQYIKLGFTRVGISEHIPPALDTQLYDDEREAGKTAADLQDRFALYFKTLDDLARSHADEIQIFRGMETEAWTGYADHVRQLVDSYAPDYIVGSVHHVRDICFDYSPDHYQEAAKACGGIIDLYRDYFDLQLELIQALTPFVVGHFDIIRIHDPQYETHLRDPRVWKKILGNLDAVKDLGLAMDFNLRPLSSGKPEPYLAPFILDEIQNRNIAVVPGDDSHGVHQAGVHVPHAIEILKQRGMSTDWPLPPS